MKKDGAALRRVRYSVAMSLDGYIAGPNGEFDWIVIDSDVDFASAYSDFDTILMGRKTYDVVRQHGGGPAIPGIQQTLVFSRTLEQKDCESATVARDPVETIQSLRKQPGKDMWLFGGGGLFRSLLDLSLVDRVEVAIVPVLLGGGIPVLPTPATQSNLRLKKHKVYPKTGTVSLEYEVAR